MNIYLISNNLVLNDITYESDIVLEEKRTSRPLSIEGEELAKRISEIISAQNIYSSNYASALATAKYIANKNNTIIKIDKRLNDSKIGVLGRHNIKMLRYMQEKNFDYKFDGGESLNDTSNRMNSIFKSIIKDVDDDVVIVTHKRAMLALLLKHCEQGLNLDERLILSYNNKVILDDTENDCDIIKIEIEDKKVKNVDFLENLWKNTRCFQ